MHAIGASGGDGNEVRRHHRDTIHLHLVRQFHDNILRLVCPGAGQVHQKSIGRGLEVGGGRQFNIRTRRFVTLLHAARHGGRRRIGARHDTLDEIGLNGAAAIQVVRWRGREEKFRLGPTLHAVKAELETCRSRVKTLLPDLKPVFGRHLRHIFVSDDTDLVRIHSPEINDAVRGRCQPRYRQRNGLFALFRHVVPNGGIGMRFPILGFPVAIEINRLNVQTCPMKVAVTMGVCISVISREIAITCLIGKPVAIGKGKQAYAVRVNAVIPRLHGGRIIMRIADKVPQRPCSAKIVFHRTGICRNFLVAIGQQHRESQIARLNGIGTVDIEEPRLPVRLAETLDLRLTEPSTHPHADTGSGGFPPELLNDGRFAQILDRRIVEIKLKPPRVAEIQLSGGGSVGSVDGRAVLVLKANPEPGLLADITGFFNRPKRRIVSDDRFRAWIPRINGANGSNHILIRQCRHCGGIRQERHRQCGKTKHFLFHMCTLLHFFKFLC